MVADILPVDSDVFDSAAANGHEPFFIAFTYDAYKTDIEIELL